ncbi:hypothetical protein VHEMI00859 [[Torrubiella] hemipterigena]|uniref:Uncharacterized protein n=1 Tax=[Torrubiella] hemipterigena TaxID=1531966 RepID=A0A0A1SKG5_9HYPO|nr:hypothetical protein VHEMI00859 [[Torrubiella] hemipterigena]
MEPLAYFTDPRPEYLTHPSSLDTISQLQGSNNQFPLSWGADPVTIHQSFSEPQSEPQHLVPGSASDAYPQVVSAPFPILDQSIAARVNPSESSTPSSNSYVPIWNTLSSELLVGHPEPLLLSSTAESGVRVSSPIASSNPLFQVLVELGHPPPVPDRLTEIVAEISLPSHWMSKLNDLCRRMLGMSVHLRELEGEGPKNWLNREHVDFPIEALLTTMNEFYVTIETSLAGAREAQEENGDQNHQICWFDKDDENNIRLVVSVYDRIVDILRRLFALAREEHDKAQDRGIKVLFKRWLQPGVKVGALTLPQFPVVKMAVLTDSVVTILTLLRTATKSFSPAVLDAVSASGPEKMNGSKSSLTDVVDTNFQNLMRKEADLVRFLCDLRDDLTTLLGHHPSAVQYIRDRKAARRI